MLLINEKKMQYTYYILVSDEITLSCCVWCIGTFTISKDLITKLFFFIDH